MKRGVHLNRLVAGDHGLVNDWSVWGHESQDDGSNQGEARDQGTDPGEGGNTWACWANH